METIKETAKLLGLTEYFVRQKVRNGEVVAVKCGTVYLVNVDKFIDFLNGKNIKAPNDKKGGEADE